jgi:hypothetical protein
LLEQSGNEDEKRKYRKAAELILLKAVHLEPENEEAKILLQSARAVPFGFSSRPPQLVRAPEPLRAEEPIRLIEHARMQEPVNTTELQMEEEVPFVAAPVFKSLEPGRKQSGLKLPLGLIATVLIGAGGLWMLQSRPGSRTTLAAPAVRNQPVVAALPPALAENPTPAPPADAKTPPAVSQANNGAQTSAVNPPSAVSPPPPAPPAAAAVMGNLAVSSATAAEIYQGGRYLGSTPTTLQLPAGRQTLEYRHGALRTVVTHDIKNNQTVAASITFQQTVQINSKPWAQVFVDGTTRRPLGQTPLSGVSIPIGGVLVFENPNFPLKTYRITDQDTAIQVDFP